MKVFHEFEPWFDSNSKILILGSIPSVKSRELGYYYAHPSNRFWKVLETLFQEPIFDKKAFCLKHSIALWDVLESCDIDFSKDSSIKDIALNDLNRIFSVCTIKQVFTTGKKAHAIYEKYLYPLYHMPDLCLPSTSPANAQYSLQKLVEEYAVIQKYLN